MVGARVILEGDDGHRFALVFWSVCWSVGHPFVVINNSLLAGLPVTYQRYMNNEFVPASVLGPSTQGERCIRIVYERNGHVQEHDARPASCHLPHMIAFILRRGTLTACFS